MNVGGEYATQCLEKKRKRISLLNFFEFCASETRMERTYRDRFYVVPLYKAPNIIVLVKLFGLSDERNWS